MTLKEIYNKIVSLLTLNKAVTEKTTSTRKIVRKPRVVQPVASNKVLTEPPKAEAPAKKTVKKPMGHPKGSKNK